MLEIIDKGTTTEAHPSPLLFVHGGCHAAWCWNEHFLDYFASQGFRAAALSWRAHGGSTSDKPLSKCSVADYVDDVHTAAQRLDGAPIVVGHSLGGFTVQKYLEGHDAPAAVLLASVPPRGVLGSAMRIWLRHPWIAMRANTIGESDDLFKCLPRELLFCQYTPDAIVQRYAGRCQPESMRASFTDAAFRLPKPDRVSAPILVLGGEDDGIITNAEVRATGRAYGTTAELFPQMGHNMMLEPGWRNVAERICQWLTSRNL